MLARGSEKASGEMTFKWRLKEVEEGTPVGIWTKDLPGGRNSMCKGPEVGGGGHGEDSGLTLKWPGGYWRIWSGTARG